MKKFFILLACGLCACTTRNNAPDPTGCWMEILPPDATYTQGMQLFKDGSAAAIGTATLRLHSWQRSDDRLILSGTSIGNGQSLPFSDTLRIVRLTADSLTLQRGDLHIAYVRHEPAPSRPAYEGFEWTELNGAGLRMLVQQNDYIHLLADPTLPGIVEVKADCATPRPVIRVFDLPHGDINDVLATLALSPDWDATQTCRFEEVATNRTDVRRYLLRPDGQYAEQMDALMQQEPVPATCNGWGVGNSGNRYFEIHTAHPDKALFVEIGQDAPLFDETSIAFSDETVPYPSCHVLYTAEGEVCIGHEVRAFRPADSDKEYWIVDKTGELNRLYDEMTHGQKNGKPLRATLRMEYDGQWDNGFAADYDGVFLIWQIVQLGE